MKETAQQIGTKKQNDIKTKHSVRTILIHKGEQRPEDNTKVKAESFIKQNIIKCKNSVRIFPIHKEEKPARDNSKIKADSYKKQDIIKNKNSERAVQIHKEDSILEDNSKVIGDSCKNQVITMSKYNETNIPIPKDKPEVDSKVIGDYKEQVIIGERDIQMHKEGKPSEDNCKVVGDSFKKQVIVKSKHTERNVQVHKDGKLFEEKRKDSGDIFKIKIFEKNDFKSVPKPSVSDRGDTNKVTNSNKIIAVRGAKDKFNDRYKKPNEIKPKPIVDAFPEIYTMAAFSNNRNSEINAAAVNKSKAVERKPISDKINLKTKILNNLNKDTKNPIKTDLKTDRLKVQQFLKPGSRETSLELKASDKLKTVSDLYERDWKDARACKKPMIKTVKSKNDDKVYKSVTFTENKRVKPTMLQIRMPSLQVKKTKNKLVDKNLEAKIPVSSNKSSSKLSEIDKIQASRRHRLNEKTKRKRLNRFIMSVSPEKFKKMDSPPTEVAKWGPSCINTHTKPYYEAWINTTLAAITKLTKKDKMFLQKENIIKAFKRSFESRVPSPELVHEDFMNENYAGKIKVRHSFSKASKPTSKRQPLITPLLDRNIDNDFKS